MGGSFDGTFFKLCHFVKPMFKDLNVAQIGSTVIMNSKEKNF